MVVSDGSIVVYRLQFSHSNENWSLIGYCELRKDIRSFVVSRIRDISLTEKQFTIPSSFSIERYIEESFDQIHEETVQHVSIRFTPYQAQWIREHRWHVTLQVEEQEDGSLVLNKRVGALDALMHRVMRYGLISR